MEEPEILKKESIQRYRCGACGADLLFEPKNGSLSCPFCQHNEAIPESNEKVEEQPYEAYLQIRPDQLQVMAENTKQVDCASCGAQITFAAPDIATSCSFCGAAIVAQPKSADPILCPEGVLPFKIDKQAASEALQKWIATRWFAPDALKRFAAPGAIAGVYIPYWTYDTFTYSHYSGQRGEWYYVTESYTETDEQGNTVQRTREVRHTRWFFVSGTVQRNFDDILVPATKSVSEHHLLELEPWDLPELKPYDPAFLAGFKAQRYQLSLPDGFARAKQLAAPKIENDVRADIGGDEQMIAQIQTQYKDITFKHILLPVYIGAYHFKEKLFQIVVNGRTAEVQGQRPYSWIKITLFSLLLIAIFTLIVYMLKQNSH